MSNEFNPAAVTQLDNLIRSLSVARTRLATGPNVAFDPAAFIAWLATDLPQVIGSLVKLFAIITG